MALLTHLDTRNNAIMVDVASKPDTKRTAVASGKIRMNHAAYTAVAGGTAPKGDVLSGARIAGIMAVKQTSTLIPLCHTLLLTSASIDFTFLPQTDTIETVCTVSAMGKTGVEMEALTGVSVALLTIYDFCKAIDRSMHLEDVHLRLKDGGKSGHYEA